MKNFMLFGGHLYDGFRDPNGGWEDFQSSYDSVSAALIAVDERHLEWFQIVDRRNAKIVSQGDKS